MPARASLLAAISATLPVRLRERGTPALRPGRGGRGGGSPRSGEGERGSRAAGAGSQRSLREAVNSSTMLAWWNFVACAIPWR